MNKPSKASQLEIEAFGKKERLRLDLKNKKEGAREQLKLLPPEEVFAIFDSDDSGLISFDEFRGLLPYLNININDAKAFRFFRLCDDDQSGYIDIDEFKVMLYICDPNGGNQIGFVPTKHISPLDAFELFDEDRSGDLDEDEFIYAMEYLGIQLSDASSEKIFQSYDTAGSGTLTYSQFRDIFLTVCDIKQELVDRSIDIGGVTNPIQLRQLLYKVILEEDQKEMLAIEETKKFKERQSQKRELRKNIQLAKFRSYAELRSALDLAGQVYVFGEGNNKQFNNDSLNHIKSSSFEFKHFNRVAEIWKNRVYPQQLVDLLHQQRKAEEHEKQRDLDRRRRRGELIDDEDDINNRYNRVLDPYIEAKKSLFNNLNVSLNTCALYGRRIFDIAVSESVIFAVADTGEIYSWGGRGHNWHEIQPDSIYQSTWRGETTPRSQILLGTLNKPIPVVNTDDSDLGVFANEDEKKAEIIKTVSKYYNVWEPPPNINTRMQFLEKVLLVKISYEDLKLSLTCRGKTFKDREVHAKMKLLEELYTIIILEKRLLGERAHETIKSLESQIKNLKKSKKDQVANRVMSTIRTLCKPILIEQENHLMEKKKKEEESKEQSDHKKEIEYINWRDKVIESREDLNPVYTPRGNSLQININGVTPRGAGLKTPRNYQFITGLAAGANHACLVHKSGQLYSWGIGTSGKLGLDLSEGGDPQQDALEPRLVQAFRGKVITDVACGACHTGAIVLGGELWMWGSATSGALGIGDMVMSQDCYCSLPTRVMIGSDDFRVMKISCGSSHTGIVTEQGHVYVFGCGDGNRLGVGNCTTIYTPTLVDTLLHEKISSISCGNSTTIVVTQLINEIIIEEASGMKIQRYTGGRVYVTGSSNSLGKDYNEFTCLQDIADIPIKQVSAGYRHNALVSVEGELLCWGSNYSGCSGFSPKTVSFVYRPTVVECLYSRPTNMALKKIAYQSSTFNNRDASYAVDGNTSGKGLMCCSCTQEDSQAWLEVDLGCDAIIVDVFIYNRTDSPRVGLTGLPDDFFTKRLIPCYAMIGKQEFEKGTNVSSLNRNINSSLAKMKFVENNRLLKWKCPPNTVGRYVRVQLKGTNFLNIAQLEVYGWQRDEPRAGRVSSAVAGRDVTVAVIRPSTRLNELESVYKRAAYTDTMNVEIIRQYETYFPCYKKYGKCRQSDRIVEVDDDIDKNRKSLKFNRTNQFSDKATDRQTERQTERQTSRQTNRFTGRFTMRSNDNGSKGDLLNKQAEIDTSRNTDMMKSTERLSIDTMDRSELTSPPVSNYKDMRLNNRSKPNLKVQEVCYICRGVDKCEICLLKDIYMYEIDQILAEKGDALSLDEICEELMKDKDDLYNDSDGVIESIIEQNSIKRGIKLPNIVTKSLNGLKSVLKWIPGLNNPQHVVTKEEALLTHPESMYNDIISRKESVGNRSLSANSLPDVKTKKMAEVINDIDAQSISLTSKIVGGSLDNEVESNIDINSDELNATPISSFPRRLGKPAAATYAIPRQDRLNLMRNVIK